MQVVIVGAGKLARELQGALNGAFPWAERIFPAQRSIVVHAGSGRELQPTMEFCEHTRSTLIELATGTDIGSSTPKFPLVICPNTNILMLKFMSMLEKSGPLFHQHPIELTESHQANKSSVPGTAVAIARSLGLAESSIRSVRDPGLQETALQIPVNHLARHAYHQLRIGDGVCSLTLETRVYGDTAYADGVALIVAAVQKQELENRLYSVMEFIDRGWI